ncbi:MAG: beta-aspartyl-peptidase [Bacteroidetes bacterium HGW-Bacteroidetes-12]|nr:MAG: beta-aspartyl-peptidase [Bacteroidetes bacterium HGW-Bacteroidetes-12]
MSKIAIAIHGGAGTILKKDLTPEKEAAYLAALDNALAAGYSVLEKGGSSLDAVEQAVVSLENTPLFNAGKGSVFTKNGTHEMDASIMEGKTKMAGAVSLITGIKNPVSLARLVMEKSEHVFMAGEGALEFAKLHHCKTENSDYFYDEYRFQQWQAIKNADTFQLDHATNKDKKFGTVGAVAIDVNGTIAAATSTGGMTNKKFGRVGDSPMIGAGTYANNQTCGISCTGSGEFFIRGVVAYDVSCLMEYKGLSLQEACDTVIKNRLPKIGGDGGLIGVDKNGNLAFSFNTEGMYRGKKTSNETYVGIYK